MSSKRPRYNDHELRLLTSNPGIPDDAVRKIISILAAIRGEDETELSRRFNNNVKRLHNTVLKKRPGWITLTLLFLSCSRHVSSYACAWAVTMLCAHLVFVVCVVVLPAAGAKLKHARAHSNIIFLCYVTACKDLRADFAAAIAS